MKKIDYISIVLCSTGVLFGVVIGDYALAALFACLLSPLVLFLFVCRLVRVLESEFKLQECRLALREAMQWNWLSHYEDGSIPHDVVIQCMNALASTDD